MITIVLACVASRFSLVLAVGLGACGSDSSSDADEGGNGSSASGATTSGTDTGDTEGTDSGGAQSTGTTAGDGSTSTASEGGSATDATGTTGGAGSSNGAGTTVTGTSSDSTPVDCEAFVSQDECWAAGCDWWEFRWVVLPCETVDGGSRCLQTADVADAVDSHWFREQAGEVEVIELLMDPHFVEGWVSCERCLDAPAAPECVDIPEECHCFP